ncbi:MAG: ABC transporter permease [Gammaproteobacteria bacterium]|nr:ABC transporter permease [Gammaproteobacteria bacterium]
MIQRTLAILRARNLEFLRDRASLSWNLAFPFLLIFGLALTFSNQDKPVYKVGILPHDVSSNNFNFQKTRFIDFVPEINEAESITKVARHQIDLLIDVNQQPARYWINPTSKNGYFAEQLFLRSVNDQAQRINVEGKAIGYVDWLVPGVLAMNMMFSCLFGIGYVIVRYRKTGYLKRLSATPVTATEFLIAQILSRVGLTLITVVIVYAGISIFVDFPMHGNHFLLLLVAALGAISLTSLALCFSARGASEELANGLINLALWPMMMFSGVWFSLEGTAKPIQWLSQVFPLTHMVNAARAIMLEGAGFAQIWLNLTVLASMSLIFIIIGTCLFRWTND